MGDLLGYEIGSTKFVTLSVRTVKFSKDRIVGFFLQLRHNKVNMVKHDQPSPEYSSSKSNLRQAPFSELDHFLRACCERLETKRNETRGAYS